MSQDTDDFDEYDISYLNTIAKMPDEFISDDDGNINPKGKIEYSDDEETDSKKDTQPGENEGEFSDNFLAEFSVESNDHNKKTSPTATPAPTTSSPPTKRATKTKRIIRIPPELYNFTGPPSEEILRMHELFKGFRPSKKRKPK